MNSRHQISSQHLVQQNEWHYNPRKYWERYEKAPESIPRPVVGQKKGCLYFFASAVDCMDGIWEQIRSYTLCGLLGYYCGFSDNSQVIAIHFADPSIEELQEDIKCKLIDLGVDRYQIKFKTIIEKNDLHWYRTIAED